MSDMGHFISVVRMMTQNDLKELESNLVIHKGGRPKTTGRSSIKCLEKACKVSLVSGKNSKTGYTKHWQNKKSPVSI